MSPDGKLDQLAEHEEDGEGTIAPERGADAEAFQATVSRVRRYAEQGYLIILREKRESHTAQRLCILYGSSQSRLRAVLLILDTNWTQRFSA